jgi:adenylate cyclase, class 2
MPIEVEQKFAVDDHREVQARLLQLGAHEIDRVEQVDRYFNHPARDFAQTDEALRLRRVGDANFITYKGPKLDAATKTRREIELPLGTGSQHAAEYAELLTALGFRLSGEVHKTRRIMHLNWRGKGVEIALDMVTGLGSFVELEISADEHEIEPAKAAIASLAAELKLDRNERRSYLELLLAKH